MLELIYLYIQLHVLPTHEVTHVTTLYCDTHTNLFEMSIWCSTGDNKSSRPGRTLNSDGKQKEITVN